MQLSTRPDQALQQQTINGDLYARFVAYLDAKPRTVEEYSKSLRVFFNYLADNGISRPDREDVITYRDCLKEKYKAATVTAYIVPVRLFFRWTYQEGLYPNIAEHVKGAKLSKAHKKDALTTRQTKDVLAAIDRRSLQGKRDYAIMALMVTCGLRTVEVSRALIEDLRTVGDSPVLYLQGKGRDDKDEYAKIPPQVEKAIRSYLKARGSAAPSAPLFASVSDRNNGEALTTRSISRIAKERLVQAGYDSDRITAHSLRHTAATLNLLNGGTLAETQQLLRHGNINTTMIYLHHLERAKNDSEARIAAAIF